MSEERAKAQFIKAINDITKRIGGLVAMAERHGEQLQADDLAKGFGFLQAALNADYHRAQAARKTIGTFSLDAGIESYKAQLPSAGPTVPSPKQAHIPVPFKPQVYDDKEEVNLIDDDDLAVVDALEGRREVYDDEKTTVLPPKPQPRPGAKPIGRLVGTKEPVFALPDDEPKRRPKIDPREVPDKTGAIVDAGFIDD